jgi:biopolymer transport protein ExbD
MAGGFSAPQEPSGGKQKKYRRQGVLVEPPAMLLVDISFNLLLFFVALASNDPTQGRRQDVPRGQQQQGATGPPSNFEVALTRTTVSINNQQVALDDVSARMRASLAGKTRTEDRIVVLRSSKDTPYALWVRVTGLIERAGGIVTLQLEEERSVQVQ